MAQAPWSSRLEGQYVPGCKSSLCSLTQLTWKYKGVQGCPSQYLSVVLYIPSQISHENMNMKYRSQTLEFCGNLVISCDLVLRLVMPVFQKKHHTVDALFAALHHALGTSKRAYEKLLKQLISSQRWFWFKRRSQLRLTIHSHWSKSSWRPAWSKDCFPSKIYDLMI